MKQPSATGANTGQDRQHTDTPMDPGAPKHPQAAGAGTAVSDPSDLDPLALDGLLADLAADRPAAPPGLMARVMADAYALQPAPPALAPLPPPQAAARPGLWAALLAALGGAPALAGLATATLAGVWVGFAQPAPVSTPITALSEVLWSGNTLDQVELFPDWDTALGEG